MRKLLTFLFSSLIIPPASAVAEDCSKVLINDVSASDTFSLENLAIASTLTNESYQKATSKGGLNGTIYGIPIGANYEDFQNNVNITKSTLNINKFQLHINSYITSRLSENGLEAYKLCKLGDWGLVLAVGDLTRESANLWVTWKPFPDIQKGISGIVAQPRNIDDQSLQALTQAVSAAKSEESFDQAFRLVPNDPKKEMTLSIRMGRTSRDITIHPLEGPRIVKEILEGPESPESLTGYATGRYDCIYHDRKEYTLGPSRPNAVFVQNSDYVVELHTAGGHWYKKDEKGSNPIIIRYSYGSDNTSGCINSSAEKIKVIAKQRYIVEP